MVWYQRPERRQKSAKHHGSQTKVVDDEADHLGRVGGGGVRKKELKQLQEKILPVLQPYQVKRVAIFGSVVRGEDAPGSDR